MPPSASPPATPRRRFIFVGTLLARGGTLSVMSQFWERLGRLGLVEVIVHGPSSVEVAVPTHELGARRLSNLFRFPDVLVYSTRLFAACVGALRRGPAPPALLIPQDSLGTGIAAILAGRLTGTRVAVMEHGTGRAIESEFFWRVRLPPARLRDRLARPMLRACLALMHRVSLRLLDAALLPSQEAVDMYRRFGVPGERIFRYHVPIDVDRFRPGDAAERLRWREQLKLPHHARIVLSVSRLTPEKGIDTLLDAVARLPDEQRQRTLLVVAGEGRLRDELEAQAARLPARVRFTGALSAEDLPGLLRCADLFVYAARQGSNVPVSVLEAMASGLPVVATNEPVAHEEILADGRGTVIPPDDPAAMADGIERQLQDPDSRRSGELARHWVVEQHAPTVLDRELNAFLAALEKLPRRSLVRAN